jgi:radical SAM superfamily enzyme YgiQ (UPF0313 family)
MRSLRIGVLELLVDTPIRQPPGLLYALFFRKQFVSLGPQFVSAWCRQLGHRVHYATYWGQRDPERLLPRDLDVVFIGTHTPTSLLAYALAKVFGRAGAITVIGGPHARCFPQDCLRFFDYVVLDCDKALIDDILRGRRERPAVLSTGAPLVDVPTVAERRVEIEAAAFVRGRPTLTSVIPMLSSVGCPYACDFCVDWDTPYHAVPASRLLQELELIADRYPGCVVGYHDPNFAVRFDETMDVIESLPPRRRNGYIMESSLAILKEQRLARLKRTNCVYVAPGIESWTEYSNKSGTTGRAGRDKLEQLVGHMHLLARYVPGIQTNIMVGTDAEEGSESVELTKEFIHRLPDVWPTINIPTPFGGTPLHLRYIDEGRVLSAMPFAFYYNPYLSIVLKNYSPIEYYDHLIDIHEAISSREMLWKRLRTSTRPAIRFIHTLRTFGARRELAELRAIRRHLSEDRRFTAFHCGDVRELPEFYHRRLEGRLGRYAELLSRDDRTPVFDEQSAKNRRPSVAASVL